MSTVTPDFSQIEFNVQYNDNNIPKDITVTDSTNVPGIGGGITDSDIVSWLIAKMPNGSTFHAGSFASPDVQHPTPLTFDINPVLDINNDFILGNYTYDYVTRLTDFDFSYDVVDLDDTLGEFTVAENIPTGTTSGSTVIVTTGPVSTVITVLSETILPTGGTLIKFTPISIPAGPWEYQFTRTVDFTITRTFNLQTVAPEVCIDQTFSCNESTFTSTDATDYGTAATVDRTHTVIWPPDIQPSPPADVVGTAKIVILGPNIFTGVFTTIISSVVTFSFGNGFFMVSTVGGSDSLEVDCEDLYCQIKCGLDTFNAKFQKAISCGEDPDRVLPRALGLILNLQAYLAAVACNDTVAAQDLATIIKKALDGCGCDCTSCDDDCDDEFPVEIIPITIAAGVVLVTTPTGIFVQAGAPIAELGNDGDIYINDSNGDLYNKVAGAWILQFNITGATGATGVAGTDGTNGTNGTDGIDAFIYVGYSDDGLIGSFSLFQTPTTQFINFITSNVALTPDYADFTDPWLQYVVSIGSINDHSDVDIPDTFLPPLLNNDLHLITVGNELVGLTQGWSLFGQMLGEVGVLPIAGFNPVGYYISNILPFMPLSGIFSVNADKFIGDVLFEIPTIVPSFPSEFWVFERTTAVGYLLRADPVAGGIELKTLTAMTATLTFSLDGYTIRID